MEGVIKINKGLLPLSWLYGIAVRLRNFCFDAGILKSRSFDIPVIAVGNITVGGTGKTPHVEYLIRLLQEQQHVAVLSRGYKRKSRGFRMADSRSTARDIGDEPYQMKQKFPDVTVAVDKKRTEGISRLAESIPGLGVVLLDDAFQHRYVKPGINILLVDSHRLITNDRLLPAGRLREPLSGKSRADIVIVTKCPKSLQPVDYRAITKALDLRPCQQLLFTTLDYDAPYPVFPTEAGNAAPGRWQDADGEEQLAVADGESLLLITGIASPQHLMAHLAPRASRLSSLTYPDHHNFTPRDVARINATFAALPAPKRIITTEKDASRIKGLEGLSAEVRSHLYALPVRVSFVEKEQQDKFNENITNYVRKNSRDSILAQSTDDHQS